MPSSALENTPSWQVYTKDTIVEGGPAKVKCLEINGQVFTIGRGFPRVMSLEDENEDQVRDPEALLAAVARDRQIDPDIVTFWQEWPVTEPKYPYRHEWFELAVLSFSSYEDWWNRGIKSPVRNTLRKAEKCGVSIRETSFDDEFVRGMTAIFNESPVRQGRRFWHYGKDEATVKKQFSRFIHQERVAGAYLGEEMIGFIMVGNNGRAGYFTQIISKIAHRDKRVNEALVAKAVEICASQGNECLVYAFWGDSSLVEFKRKFGFQPVRVPRYVVPVSWQGSLAVRLGLHRGLGEVIPQRLVRWLKRIRAHFYGSVGG